MAHISRAQLANNLLEQLDRPVDVVYDTDPPSRDTEQRWATGRRAWEAAADVGADWSLVLQDDAVPCQDLIAGLEAALSHLDRPAVVSAYLGAGRPVPNQVARAVRIAEDRHESWAQMVFCYWGVGICLPTEVVPDMLEWATAYRRRNYDTRVGQYVLKVLRWPAMYTFPSLVDHLDAPSLVTHSSPGRVAARFLQGSALDVDWSRLPRRGGLVQTR